MNRIFLFAAAFVLLAAPAFAQIAIPESVPAGRIGEAKSTVIVPDGARVKRKWSVSDPRVDLKVPGDGEIVYYTSRNDLECTLTQTIVIATDDDLKMDDYHERLVIGKPTPTEPDKPQPPAPKTLRQMTSKESADILADCYSDLAELFASITDTPAQFESVHKAMRSTSPSVRGLKDVAEVYATIDESLAKAVKVEPWKDSVFIALTDVVEQLSGDDPVVVDPVDPKPTDPVVTPPLDEPSTPVSFDGFHVLFVEEGTTREPWFDMLTSTNSVISYLNSHTENGPKGWRKWDQHEQGENAPVPFNEMAKVPRPGINCVVIGSKKKAYVYQLTKKTTDDELMALLKKFGGD